jgi:5-methylcytosine-specific restriction endonuclease McrA
MTTLAKTPVLVLNASYEPVNICSGRRALSLMVAGTARVEASRERHVRPGMQVPSVIRLTSLVKVPHRSYPVTRKGIMVRDRNTCQYCSKRIHHEDATLDHVMPQSRGGKNTWENLVACCRKCNRDKGNRTPEEWGRALLHKPRAVNIHTSRHLIRELGADERDWRKYLYYDSEDVAA